MSLLPAGEFPSKASPPQNVLSYVRPYSPPAQQFENTLENIIVPAGIKDVGLYPIANFPAQQVS